MSEPVPDVTLRPWRPDDVEPLAALLARPEVLPGTLRIPFAPTQAMAPRLANPGPGVINIIAEAARDVIGFVSLQRNIGRMAHCGDVFIAVHEAHWGRGVGRRLMEAAIDVADNWLGLRRIQLETYVDNARAITLYESLGFAREGTLRASALRDGALVDSFVMGRVVEGPRYDG